MSSPGGQEVGRVSIRVVPDTSRFRRDLQEQLRRETQGIEIEIPIDLDTGELRQKLQAAARAASAGVDAEIGVDVNRSVTNQVRDVVDQVNDAVSRSTSEISVSEQTVRGVTEIQRNLGEGANSAVGIRTQLQAAVGPAIQIGRATRESASGVDALDRSVRRVGQSVRQTQEDFSDFQVRTRGVARDRAAEFDALRRATQHVFEPSRFGTDDFLGELSSMDRAIRRAQGGFGEFGNIVRGIDFEARNAGADMKDWFSSIRDSRREAREFRKDMEYLREAAARAGDPFKELERITMIASLDADLTLLRRKIAEGNRELDELQRNGRDIVIDANIAPFLAEYRKVESQLERLEAKRWTPEIEVKIDEKRAELAALEAQMERISAQDWTAEVEVRVDRGRAELARLQLQLLRMEARRTRLDVDVVVDNNTLRNSLSSALATVGRGVGQGLLGAMSGVFVALASLFPRLIGGPLRAVSSSFQSVGSIGQSAMSNVAGAIVQVVASLALVVLQIGLVAGALAIVGAAATAAFGIVAGVIAPIPGLLLGLGAGFGVVYLGFDGIKAAAKSIEPVLDSLKAKVSETFEKGLTPEFQKIGEALTKLTPDILKVADNFVLLGSRITTTLTSGQGFTDIEKTLSNVSFFVRDITPGIDNMLEGFLRLAAQSSIWSMLSSSINSFSTSFQNAVNTVIADGTLDGAMSQLSGTFFQLSEAINSLVVNGLNVLEGAGPGVNSFLASITAFFNRFDYERLGGAVGDVFKGLGEIFDGVDDATIEEITKAFEEIGDTFRDPAFQQGVRDFIAIIPDLLRIFNWTIQRAGGFGTWLKEIFGFFDELKTAADNGFGLPEWLQTLLGWNVGQGGQVEIRQGSIGGFKNPFEGWNVPELPKIDDLEVEVKLVGLESLNIDPAINTMMQNAALAVAAGFTTISTVTVPAGMLAISTAITGDQQVALSWTTAVQNWSSIVTTALTGIATVAVPIGMLNIGGAVLDGLFMIGEHWLNFTGLWVFDVNTAMAAIVASVNNGMVSVQTSVAVGMANSTVAFQNGWMLSAAATTAGIAVIVASTVAGMAVVVSVVRTAGINMGAAWQAGWNMMVQITIAGINGVMSLLNTLPGRIVGAIPNPLRILYEAGRSIMRGLLDGIVSAAQDVYNYVAGIAGRIAALKGPLPYDRRLLIPAGLAIMEGLDAGLRDGFGQVLRTVSDMAPAIVDGFQTEGIAGIFDGSLDTSQYVSGDVAQTVKAEEFGDIEGRVAEAISGWTVKQDPNATWKMVKNMDTRRERRG